MKLTEDNAAKGVVIRERQATAGERVITHCIRGYGIVTMPHGYGGRESTVSWHRLGCFDVAERPVEYE